MNKHAEISETFDDVLGKIGGFGLYQKRVYILICLAALCTAFSTMIIVFILGEHRHRCAIPGLDNDTFKIQNRYHRQYVNFKVPSGKDGECFLYNSSNATPPREYMNNTIMQTESLNESKVPCSRWVYDDSVFQSTVISDMDLVCEDQIKQSHANMIYFAGFFVGSLIFGPVGDLIGRKPSTCICITLLFISSIALVWTTSYIYFVIFRFFAGVANMGFWCIAIILGLEIVSPSKRKYIGLIIELFWCAGSVCMCLIAYLIRDWRYIQLAVSIPVFFLLSYWFILPESPRWLICKGRKNDANKILLDMMKVNKSNISTDCFAVITSTTSPQKGPILPFLKSRILVLRWMVTGFNWLTISLVYYGLMVNVGKLGGNIFVNYTAFVVVEIIGYSLCLVLIDKVGRRLLHCSSMLLSGTACLATILASTYGGHSSHWIIVGLSMVGKLGISCAFGGIYLYTTEIFPTVIRASILGSVNLLSRTGSMIAPYVADLGTLTNSSLGKALPLVILGSVTIVAGLMSLYLPESKGMKIPDTIDDAINYERLMRKTKDENDSDRTENGDSLQMQHLLQI